MIIEPCCPGRMVTKKILIGGREVGIIGLDDILWRCLQLGDVSDDVKKDFLLRALKEKNYVPRGAEGEYADGIWEEFLSARERLESMGRGDCTGCSCSRDGVDGCA